MQVITYQVGVGMDFQPELVKHYLDEKEINYYDFLTIPLKRKKIQKTIFTKNKNNLFRNKLD